MVISITTSTCRISTPGFFLSGSVRPLGAQECGTFGMVATLAPQHVRPQVECAHTPSVGMGKGRAYVATIVNDPSFDLEPLGVAV